MNSDLGTKIGQVLWVDSFKVENEESFWILQENIFPSV